MAFCLPISSYMRMMMPVMRRTPVPEQFPTVPIISAIAASAPTAAPESVVTTGIYLASTLLSTRGSRRKPGICMPLRSICLATSSGPMPVVSIQNLANRMEPIIIMARYTMRWARTW